MDRGEYDSLAREYLHHDNFTPATRDTYALSLSNWAEWFTEHDIDPEHARPADLLSFRQALQAQFAASTVNNRFKNVKQFYTWLYLQHHVERDPGALLKVKDVARATRNILTLDELAAMLEAARPGRERIIIGLLGICGLRREEVRFARTEDLHDRSGTTVLSIATRTSANELGYVAIPPALAHEIRTILDGRRTGLILQSATQGPIATTSISTLVRTLASEIGLTGKTTTLSLSYTLRSIAMEHGFPYLGVVRTIPWGSPATTSELLKNTDVPPAEHASMRLGRMLRVADSPDGRYLLQATILLADRAQPAAVTVMLAGATLERSLREATEAKGLLVTKRDPSLSTYATMLRSVELLSIAQLRTIERILTIRNLAAHGWFDEVDREDAAWVLAEISELVPALRSL
jgi:integrase